MPQQPTAGCHLQRSSGFDQPAGSPSQNSDLADSTAATVACHMNHRPYSRGYLAVGGLAAEPTQRREGLETRWNRLGGVRVHRAAPALVTGVERDRRSTSSAPRTSPTTIRSGRIRNACLTSCVIVTAPAPSALATRPSSRTQCG